ncbi:hypothetical protein RvY_03850-1 [Ramazzottius varieornatus]|uniref:Amine oxidase domain-containing protein n=1 Tax=Ramazzottius varieornatus TaxID=947166 RepID=A0A1D1UZM8_RAMVA|nr:hypothetical protein RvY_03850-1 [Ramazzottius varieornatus]
MRPGLFIGLLSCFVFFHTAISAALSQPGVPDTPGSLYTSPFTIPPTPVASSFLPLDCHIAILGAGFSGAYAAYQLSTHYKDRICVVEKLNRYGGRIHDITERADGSGPAYGIGPLGLEFNQLNMLHLARELGMEVQADDDNGATLQQVRGRYFLANAYRSNSGRMCVEVFPTLNCTGWNHVDTDKGMWKAILDLFVEQPDIVDKYADFGTFVRAIVGTEGF